MTLIDSTSETQSMKTIDDCKASQTGCQWWVAKVGHSSVKKTADGNGCSDAEEPETHPKDALPEESLLLWLSDAHHDRIAALPAIR